jgi:hypothetical protein
MAWSRGVFRSSSESTYLNSLFIKQQQSTPNGCSYTTLDWQTKAPSTKGNCQQQ